MKDILFRGKSIVADSPNTPGHWLEGCYISRLLDFEDGKLVIEHNIIERSSYINNYLDMCTEVWPETVGQFTGLLDKNGRKIFEGDIVKTKYGRLCTVIWFSSPSENCWDLEIVNTVENLSTMCPDAGDLFEQKNLEVVGNIHDNPELSKSST